MEIKSKSKEERKKIIRHKVDENTSNLPTGVVKKRHQFPLKKEATLIRWNEDNKLSGDSADKQKAYGDENITKLTEESNPDRAADDVGELLYTIYRRLKKANEAYLPVVKTSGDCFRKLRPQVPGLESGENIGVVEQLCNSRSLGNGEILKVKNVNANVSEPVPPEIEILPIDENQADGGSFRYNYTNVFNRNLSKYNKYCCFAFKYDHVRKRNSRKKSAPLYAFKAECAITGCPVTATLSIPLENIKLRGELTRRKKTLIWRWKAIQTGKIYISIMKTWRI